MHVLQLLHVWRREREGSSVEMPLIGAPCAKRSASSQMLGMRVYLCGRRSSPPDDAVCTSLAQSRVGDRGVDQCQATHDRRPVLGHAWRCDTELERRSPKGGAIRIPYRKVARDSFRSADSVADEDLLPVEHVCVLDFVASLFVHCGEKADAIEKDSPRWSLASGPSRGMAWRFCRALMIDFWSTCGGNTILDGGISRRAEFCEGLAR